MKPKSDYIPILGNYVYPQYLQAGLDKEDSKGVQQLVD